MFKKVLVIVMMLCLLLGIYQPALADSTNLIKNYGFEDGGSDFPRMWDKYDWKNRTVVTKFDVVTTEKHSGNYSAYIESNFPNDARFMQKVKVSPNSYYKLSCWVKTEGIGTEEKGANVSVYEVGYTSRDITGTNGKWEYIELYGKTGPNQDTVTLTIGIGGYGSLNYGKAWFDDVSMEKVSTLPEGVTAVNFFEEETEESVRDPWMPRNAIMYFFVSLAAIFAVALVYYLVKVNIISARERSLNAVIPEEDTGIRKTVKTWAGLDKKDFLIMSVMSLVYLAVALFRLGSLNVPETYWQPAETGEYFTLDFGKEVDLSRIYIYGGLGEGTYKIEYLDKDGKYKEVTSIKKDEYDDIFAWKYEEVSVITQKIKVTAIQTYAELFEMSFFENESKEPIKDFTITERKVSENDQGQIENLFDEQEKTEYTPSFMTSTYFDEIYHARTAYEHIKRIAPYETTHPPLGKIFIAIGVLIFGMNPFGWRIVGTLFGVALIPVMYILGKKVFGQRFFAFFAAFLMMFDFMHFTQTRIATIDSYATMFVTLMYYFMYDYYVNKSYRLGYKPSLKPLFLSGLFFGIGAASKWVCIYAGAGLALLFFAVKYMEYRDYRMMLRKEPEEREPWVKKFVSLYVNKTFLWCILFFVIIPLIIYTLSYIPYLLVEGNDWHVIIDNQKFMYKYHSKDVVSADHDFASAWWTWPLLIRPMWFYDGDGLPQGMASSIVTMGNPAVWWVGTLAVFTAAVIAIRKRDKRMVPIFVAIIFQYLPWVFVARTTFIYHFFTVVPFMIISIVYVAKYLMDRFKYAKYGVYAYMGVVAALFVMFYPVLSGLTVSEYYIDTFLRWFSTWVF